MSNRRRYLLRPWLVRCLLPDRAIGTYVLWDRRAPFYAGRSDTSLRRRLIEHAHAFSDSYFTFDVCHTADLSFDLECSLYHALPDEIRNQIHPGRPGYSAAECSFCRVNLRRLRASRLPEGFTASE